MSKPILDQHEIDHLRNIAEYFHDKDTDDDTADALFIEDVISKIMTEQFTTAPEGSDV